MSVEASPISLFEKSVMLAGYDEMLNRTIRVASMMLAESGSTTETIISRALPDDGHAAEWVKWARESCIFPVGPVVPGNELGLDTSFIQVSLQEETWHHKRPLVPRVLGGLSLGEAQDDGKTTLKLIPFVGNTDHKIELPNEPGIVVEGSVEDAEVREQLEKAAHQLSFIINYNNLQAVGPMQSVFKEYRT